MIVGRHDNGKAPKHPKYAKKIPKSVGEVEQLRTYPTLSSTLSISISNGWMQMLLGI